MAVRKIIEIDEELCDGCGDCISSCHEGALKLIDGKAKLVSDTYCDGLGDCLADCPQGAIKVIEREAVDYDQAAVDTHLAKMKASSTPKPLPQFNQPAQGGCPGAAMRSMAPQTAAPAASNGLTESQLGHWPIQLMLVPPAAPFLAGADLVICADCCPFTVPDFHQKYLTNRAVLIGCPKLDDLAFYNEKLKAIFAQAQPSRITVLRMEVPCCGGIAQAAYEARTSALPTCPMEIHTIGVRGGVIKETVPAGTVTSQ
ncbi:MAG: 4Fe-4S dicluster domain-containing protein [candidate division Zixibacteria bacterium]